MTCTLIPTIWVGGTIRISYKGLIQTLQIFPQLILGHPQFSKTTFPSTSSPNIQVRGHDGEYAFAQQKQEEYIKQLASKVDVLTTHNKMLEVQIAQQACSSSTLPDRLLRKLESTTREHCNCVTLKEGVKNLIDSKDTPFKESTKIIMVECK